MRFLNVDKKIRISTKHISVGRYHMMKKMRDMREFQKDVVLWQIKSVKDLYKTDQSKEATLNILENAINVVDKNKDYLGKHKNMSSLEKNRIALNLLSNIKHKDSDYLEMEQ